MTTRRKKIVDDDVIAGIPQLNDDEDLVIENTTKKTISRQKRQPKEPEPPAEKIIDAEFEDEPETDEPAYSPTSLAALIYQDSDSDFENQFCTVHVRRNPDGMNDNFVTKCTSVMNLPRLLNIEITADRADIEERIRSEYGGGHYFFQLRFGTGLGPSWKATLADLPEHLRHKPAATGPDPAAAQTPMQPAAPPADPMKQLIDSLLLQKQLKDSLFGEEKERLEREIADLRREVSRQPPPANQPERITLLEKALNAGTPELQKQIIDNIFPKDEDEDENEHWLVGLAKLGFEHKEEIAGFLGSLLGGLARPAAPQPPANIADFLRQPPPAGIPPAAAPQPAPFQSGFRRRAIDDSGENAVAEANENNSNKTGMDAAEQTEHGNESNV